MTLLGVSNQATIIMCKIKFIGFITTAVVGTIGTSLLTCTDSIHYTYKVEHVPG